MDRRKFVNALSVGAAATALAGCGEKDCTQNNSSATDQPEQIFKWKLVTTWPKNFPGLGSAPENFARMVKTMSNNRLQVKVYGAGELVPPFEVFDTVSQGGAELGHGAAYYWKGKNSATPFFTAVPFGLNAQEMNGWLHYGGGQELWDELYSQFNVKPFAGGSTGVQMAGWFNKEINSLADLKGLKMRIPGLGGEVFKRVGGEPVQIPGGELFTALQTGVIDATEWVGPYNDRAFGFQKIAQFYYYPGWQEPGAMLEFIVNKDALEKLPADLQEIVKVAARAVNQDMLDEYTARNNEALTDLINNQGVQLRKLPDDVLHALQAASEDVVNEIVASNPDAKKVYNSFKAFQENVFEYHKISEQAMYDIRK